MFIHLYNICMIQIHMLESIIVNHRLKLYCIYRKKYLTSLLENLRQHLKSPYVASLLRMMSQSRNVQVACLAPIFFPFLTGIIFFSRLKNINITQSFYTNNKFTTWKCICAIIFLHRTHPKMLGSFS